jgi:hypothetical protein
MTRMLRALDEFWFPPAPAARLAVLRILVGAFAFWLVGSHYSMWVEIGRSNPSLFAPVGPVALLRHPLSPELNQALIVAALVANVLFVLGWRHRFTGPAFAALLTWVISYRLSWSMIYHSMNLVALHALVLGFAPAADALSLDARRLAASAADRSPEGAWPYGFAIRLLCAVTALAYFVTGLAKVASPMGWSWATGEVIRSQVAADALRKEVLGETGGPLFHLLYGHVWLFTVMGVMTFVVELGAPLALLNKRAGQLWAAVAFMMHWGILFIMGITFRYHLSGVLYAPFFDVERLVGWLQTRRRRRTSHLIPLYPGTP